jgi:Phosphate-induced protein 1 conserved region
MKRTLGITLAVLAAVCLLRASNLLNAAHAQSEQGQANGKGHVHQLNQDNDGDVNGENSKDSTAAPELNPYGLPANGRALTTGGTATVTPKITNHGGPVIGTPRIYIIWYGNWNQSNGSDTPAGQQIIRDWGQSIGGSPYYLLNTSYPGVSGNVTWGGETTDTGTSTRLTDGNIFTVVKNAINSGRLPYDASGVYFVVTSSNVTASSGFCTQYCGWHTAGNNTNGARIRYSFVGNANRCLSSCAAQTNSPNGNAGIDGAISVLSHELEEANTDPDLNAWFDSGGAENADKCAWTFGHFQYQTASGAWANMHLGTRDYLIQRNLQQISSGDLCKVDSTHN